MNKIHVCGDDDDDEDDDDDVVAKQALTNILNLKLLFFCGRRLQR